MGGTVRNKAAKSLPLWGRHPRSMGRQEADNCCEGKEGMKRARDSLRERETPYASEQPRKASLRRGHFIET